MNRGLISAPIVVSKWWMKENLQVSRITNNFFRVMHMFSPKACNFLQSNLRFKFLVYCMKTLNTKTDKKLQFSCNKE